MDGTKLHANASQHKNLDYDRIATEILAEADAVDRARAERFGDPRGYELPPELGTVQERRARLREANALSNSHHVPTGLPTQQAPARQAARREGRPDRHRPPPRPCHLAHAFSRRGPPSSWPSAACATRPHRRLCRRHANRSFSRAGVPGFDPVTASLRLAGVGMAGGGDRAGRCRGVSAVVSRGGEQVRSAELVAALCLATDLGMGFPFEHGLHSTLIAMRLADRLGDDRETRCQTYYACLLSIRAARRMRTSLLRSTSGRAARAPAGGGE